MSSMITDETLSKICDVVENALEGIVIQFRGQFFAEGMEEKLRLEFEMRMRAHIAKQGADFDNLPDYQKDYVQSRIIEALKLFKKEYES